MPRLSIPLTEQQHRAIKRKAENLGVPQAQVGRRLLLLWLVGDLELPTGAEYQAVMDMAVAYEEGRVDE